MSKMTKKAKSTKKSAKKVQAKKSTKVQPKKAEKVAKKPVKVSPSKYPRCDNNPYRRHSAYAHIFDVIHAHKQGLNRRDLVRIVAEETGDLKHTLFNTAVVLSPTEDGAMHKSAKGQSYWVKKTNDHVQLVIR